VLNSGSTSWNVYDRGYIQAQTLCRGGFEIRNWTSNSKTVLSYLKNNGGAENQNHCSQSALQNMFWMRTWTHLTMCLSFFADTQYSETIRARLLWLGMQTHGLLAHRKFVSAGCHAHFSAHKHQKIVNMNADISETIKDRELRSQI